MNASESATPPTKKLTQKTLFNFLTGSGSKKRKLDSPDQRVSKLACTEEHRSGENKKCLNKEFAECEHVKLDKREPDVPELVVVSDDEDASEDVPALEDESMSDDSPKPSQNVIVSSTDSTGSNTPLNGACVKTPKKMTPKRLLQQQQREEKLKEKQRMREERERKLNEEKLARDKLRHERDEQRRREREERDKRKQLEIEQRNEEKRMKEEQKRIADEEKRRKKEQDEAEAELKKTRARAVFSNFFVKKNAAKNDLTDEAKVKMAFIPFEVKKDMRLAPISRVEFTPTKRQTFDERLANASDLYLSELKHGRVPGRTGRTPFHTPDDDDVVFVGDFEQAAIVKEVIDAKETPAKLNGKLLQFRENRRPPYWGTWRKKSRSVKPRRPFATDEALDYTIDSDDEWEEEEPGESLHGSDDEKESEDEYEVDNDFFVPHGYLSDGENGDEAENEATMETTDAVKQEKLKLKEMEFEAEIKRKTEKIKPRLIGIVWTGTGNDKPETVPDAIWRLLAAQMMIVDGVVSFDDCKTDKQPSTITHQEKTYLQTLPITYMSALIKLVHGNINSKLFLYREFNEYLRKKIDAELRVSKRIFYKVLNEIAEWRACDTLNGKFCWCVRDNAREQYACDAPLPNAWEYFLTPKRLEKTRVSVEPSIDAEFKVPLVEKKRCNLITLSTGCSDGQSGRIDEKLKITSDGPNDKKPLKIDEKPLKIDEKFFSKIDEKSSKIDENAPELTETKPKKRVQLVTLFTKKSNAENSQKIELINKNIDSASKIDTTSNVNKTTNERVNDTETTSNERTQTSETPDVNARGSDPTRTDGAAKKRVALVTLFSPKKFKTPATE